MSIKREVQPAFGLEKGSNIFVILRSKYDLEVIDFSWGTFPDLVENCSEGMRNVQIFFKT